MVESGEIPGVSVTMNSIIDVPDLDADEVEETYMLVYPGMRISRSGCCRCWLRSGRRSWGFEWGTRCVGARWRGGGMLRIEKLVYRRKRGAWRCRIAEELPVHNRNLPLALLEYWSSMKTVTLTNEQVRKNRAACRRAIETRGSLAG